MQRLRLASEYTNDESARKRIKTQHTTNNGLSEKFFQWYRITGIPNDMQNVIECENRTTGSKHFVVYVSRSIYNPKVTYAYESFPRSLMCDEVVRDGSIVRIVFRKLPTLLDALVQANIDQDYKREFDLVSKAILLMHEAESSAVQVVHRMYNSSSFFVDSSDNVVLFNFPYAKFCDSDLKVLHSRFEAGKEKLQFIGRIVAAARASVTVPPQVALQRLLRTTEEIVYDSILHKLWGLDTVAEALPFFKSPERIMLLGSFAYCTKNDPKYQALYQTMIASHSTICGRDKDMCSLESIFRLPKHIQNANELGATIMKHMDHHSTEYSTYLQASTILKKQHPTFGEIVNNYLKYMPSFPTNVVMAYASVLKLFK
jgi:hypothetical protein